MMKYIVIYIVAWVLWIETLIFTVANYTRTIQPLPDFWEANIVAWLIIVFGILCFTWIPLLEVLDD